VKRRKLIPLIFPAYAAACQKKKNQKGVTRFTQAAALQPNPTKDGHSQKEKGLEPIPPLKACYAFSVCVGRKASTRQMQQLCQAVLAVVQ
jgi:hypothetical protein